MLSRVVAAIWGQRTEHTASGYVVFESGSAVSTPPELSQRGPSAPLPTAAEVQLDLSRVFLRYSAIHEQHRTLFDRYLALPEMFQDKISANMMGTMDSLERVAEALMQADVRMGATQRSIEDLLVDLGGEHLLQVQQDVREAGTALQYVRSRVDRLGSVIARMEAESPKIVDGIPR